VLIFTTDGLALFANWEKEPGAFGPIALVWAIGAENGKRIVAAVNPTIRQTKVHPTIAVFLHVFFLLFIICSLIFLYL
jgi:hypothetical protein